MVPDFGGYVTKYGLKCSDGRTILAHAFKGQDGQKVPLVWQHQHNSPENVLGHLVLQHRNDGVYANAFFNDTPHGQQAKELVKHGDIKALSIYANGLVEKNKNVMHGQIREGSLVLSGANPGAFIDDVTIHHGDDPYELDEAIIYTGLELEHASSTTKKPGPPPPGSQAAEEGETEDDGDGDDLPPDATVQEVMDSLTDQQKNVVYALIGAAMNGGDDMQQDGMGFDLPDDATAQQVMDSLTEHQQFFVHGLIEAALKHNNDNTQKGNVQVTRNVFDQSATNTPDPGHVISHADRKGIFAAAQKSGSLKAAVEEYALSHGIDDISVLFPYDQAVTDTPDFISRRMEWVAGVLSGTRKTPFARIRSWTADITQEVARAKGYIKGNMKKEEFFAVSRRITTPQTVYKKQKLDRDDIIDITDFDVVAWLQTELRVMLDEEIARAVLVGDGRDIDDPDKINATNIRPIYGDDEMYVTQLNVTIDGTKPNGADAIVDASVNGMRFYRGSGNPVLYTTLPYLSKMLLIKDTLGRRLYATKEELATAMCVSDIVACEALEATTGLIGIIVNLADYTVGADKGGQVSMFDFFDIDFNQQKYLLETRLSGAMTKYRGALVLQEFTGAGGVLADPAMPAFNTSTGVVTIPTIANVTFVSVNDTTGTESAALSSGAQTAIAAGATIHIRAKAAATFTFADGSSQDWLFTRATS